MAKKVSENKISSLSQDWGRDESNGLPFSGQAVQDFIKEGISTANTAFAERAGAQYFDPSNYTLYSFKNEEDRDLWVAGGSDSLIITRTPFSFSGTQNQVKVVSEMGTNSLYFTTAQQEAVLTVSFLSQQKGITDTNWEEVLEDFIVTVSVDKGATGTFVPVVSDRVVLNGNTLSVDVKKYIASGANRVRFTAKGAITGTTGNLIFSVNVTSMYLSPSNFAWNKPFVEGQAYLLGGMNIGGNIQKTLKVKVSGNGYEKLHEENIGTATYVTNAYFFRGLEFPGTGTGTYRMEIWLDASGLESDHLVYDIMCIAASDVNTAQIVCINETSTSASNGTSTEIMKYSVYDKGAAMASPSVSLAKDGVTFVEETLQNVPTSAVLSYATALELESEESAFDIVATLSLGSSVETADVRVDNTAAFPAVTGASFYMNAATRSNNQANREFIVNEVDGEEIAATWTGMSWAEGVDGWTTDNEGRKCLRIPAGSSVNIAKQLLSYVGDGKTVELAYKVSNVADYSENVITLATNPTESSFQGIRVKTKKVTVHSRDLKANDDAQSYPLKDEELVHMIITMVKNYKTNYGNICTIYVNGGKKCSFEFSDTDAFAAAANLIAGAQLSDMFIYKVRMYEQGFGWPDAAQNFVNYLPDRESKLAAWNKITAAMDDSFSVDYDAVYGKYNTMVIEMKDGAVLPDVLHPAGGNCDLWINIINPIEGELDEDFARLFSGIRIENEFIEGQGTTAMTYYRWNFRWKLSSAWNKRRITAKKNTASSMQDHKMGATRFFNDLHDAVVGANEAGGRVAVFQYPVYGFVRQLVEGTTDTYTYTYCGIYTIGPDKGDKATFGYNDSRFENTVMHMEGTDHTPSSVGMEYPWEQTRFDASREAMGAILSSTAIDAAWEVGMAGKLEVKEASDQAAVQSMLDSEFKPAYEVAYNNSTFIQCVSESLDQMNADPVAYRASHSGMEVFTDGVYDLYYYNVESKTYQPAGMNLLSQFGLSSSDVAGMDLAAKTEFFKSKRREAFKRDMGNYWHQDDCIFCYTFCMMIAATDNFKKNSYPYKFDSLANGGKWRWRQDDLDTIFDINNQGFSAKLFSVLVGDQTSTGSGSVFRGDNSVFWTLIKECFKDEIKVMVHRIFDEMDARASHGQSTLDRCVAYIRDLFWNKAQEYFGEGTYNADAEWTYEEAWYLRNQGKYNNDVHPLQQSLGSHYEAERDWVELRVVFLASYFNYGPFAVDNGDDTSAGQISFRAASGKTYTITPAVTLNPTILIGQSALTSAGGRVEAGTPVEVTVDDMGNNDTHIYIQGADYYSDLGDLSDIQVSADNPVFTVSSKRLRKLKVGDEDAGKVTSNVKTLTVGACPCMEEVDARNLSSLTGNVNLSQCPRLKKAHFSGTSAANVVLPDGGKLSELSLPGTLTTLQLMNLLNLTDENLSFDDLSNIAFIRIENNRHLGGFELLRNAYQNSDELRNIRVVGFDAEGTSEDVDMIAAFATATDENGNRIYFGIDDKGAATVGLPVLDGTLTINSPVYSDTLEVVTQYYPNLEFAATAFYVRFADPEVNRIVAENWGDGNGTTVEQIEAITDIGTVFSENTSIQTFDEFEKFTGVSRIHGKVFFNCNNLESIKIPLTVTYIGTTRNGSYTTNGAFSGCSKLSIIEGLDNVQKLEVFSFARCSFLTEMSLPKVTFIGMSCFRECTSLQKVEIPNIQTIESDAFNGCTSLTECNIPESVTSIGNYAFYNCSKLEYQELILPNVTILGGGVFRNVPIHKVVLPSIVKFEYINACGAFAGRTIPMTIDLGENCTNLNSYLFSNSEEVGITMICRAKTPPSIGYPFAGGSKAYFEHIYVPDASVEAYKNATNWNAYASKIMSIFYYLGYIDFVDPAVRDICVANFDTDGDGVISIEEAAAVTDIAKLFYQNKTIENFDEFKYFTGVTKLNSYQGFSSCSKLKRIAFPEGFTSIADYSTTNMSALEYVKLPSTFVYPANQNFNIFPDSKQLEIEIDKNNSSCYIENSVIYSKDGKTILQVLSKGVVDGNISIPSNVQNLDYKSFMGADTLVNITIPDTVTRFTNTPYNGHQFTNLKSLVSVIMSSNVDVISSDCFKGCSSLKSVTNIFASQILDAAFAECTSLTSLDLGNRISSISVTTATGKNGSFYGCSNLSSLIIRNNSSVVILNKANSFTNTPIANGTGYIYVPDTLVDSYKAANNWSTYANQIKPLSEYVES